MNSRFPLAFFLSAAISVFSLPFASAGDADWPQWRGPNRDGHAAPQELLGAWPSGGPAVKWQADVVGRGYSAVAVADGRLYTMGATDEGCFAICLNADDGTPIWRTKVSRASTGDDYNHGWGGGPRSTPTVDGDEVFVLSDAGTIAGLSKSDGTLKWSVDLVKDYGGKIPVWGYSESPLVDGDRIVVTPGEANFMVGLNRATGEKVWGSNGINAPAQYVSAIKASINGKSFYVTASKPGLFGIDTETGNELFSDASTGNKVAVIPTPIIQGNDLYHTSDYGAGNTLLKLRAEATAGVVANSVYHLDDKTMRNHHGGVVLVDGVIYGFTKANGGTWMAQDLATGDTLWEEKIRPNRSGSIAYGDGRLYCYNDEDGSVYLVEPSRKGWESKGKLTLPKQTNLPRDKGAIWAHPVIADGMLIIRDQDLIFAFDIAK